jgi:hypothetical protein
MRFDTQGDKVTAEVHQSVRDMKGTILHDQMVKHTFTFDGGLVTRFEIG